jgi:hypothetical protein
MVFAKMVSKVYLLFREQDNGCYRGICSVPTNYTTSLTMDSEHEL